MLECAAKKELSSAARLLSALTIGLLFVLPIGVPCRWLHGEDGADGSEAARLFLRQVKPLLSAKCFPCHGDDEAKIKGGLDLRSREGLLRGGDSERPALVPGSAEESPLFVAVTWQDPELTMPPKENDRLSPAQVETLRRWIVAGAPWPDAETANRLAAEAWDSSKDGVLVRTSGGLTPEWTERRYNAVDLWAFEPVESPPVPWEALPKDAPRHPIDAYVARRLAVADVPSAPLADAATLARRLSFGLTGLPPSMEDLEALAADGTQERILEYVDALLASPHYGERMAQHWLDVVRYADTAGYANDWERPHAWRYRDYVIRSFNDDKPFDRFVLEQVAGDELDPDDPEMKIAVGFLRMGPWEHTGMAVAAVTRQLWLDDVTNSVGETFLALPLRCARCHDHKFDPIPTRDYYRVQAAFAATQFASPQVPILDRENVADRDARESRAGKQLSEETLEALTRLEGDNAFTRIKKKLKDYRERALERFEPTAFSVRNDKPEQVSILFGGALERPGPQTGPGVLSAFEGDAPHVVPESQDGRRLALARWIASPEHPLTARVIVNRVWQWHFGRGLVATPNNFGKTGAKPTHPELLDWLAGWFVEHGWSLKKLHRLIVTSETYRRSTTHDQEEKLREVDPDGHFLARFRPRRLSAEEIRDAMLAVTGELSRRRGGPGVFPEINWEVALQPRHIMGSIAPSYRPSLLPGERNRRTIYAFRYRGLPDPMLEVFNRPNADVSCERRDETTVATQAFELFNGQFARDRALALAASIATQSDDPSARLELLFRRVHGRSPSAGEREVTRRHLEAMSERQREHVPEPARLPESAERQMIAEETGVLFRWREQLALDGYQRDLKPWDVPAETRALAELCLVLFNSSEFLYVY